METLESRNRRLHVVKWFALCALALFPLGCGDGRAEPVAQGRTVQAVSDSTQQLVDQALSFKLRSIRLDGGFSDRPTESFGPVVTAGAALSVDNSGGLIPADSATRTVGVHLPARASDAVDVSDTKSGMELAVRMMGVGAAAASAANGIAVYPDALGGGAHVYRTVKSDGVEDFAIVPDPSRSSVSYEVSSANVAGLRLVSNTLEFLDEHGEPRLRLAPPWIVDSHGENRPARVEVAGCNYDTNASPPWGRPVVAPDSATCQVRVSWSDTDLTYPLLLDPSWTATGSLSQPRYGHAMSRPYIGSTYDAMACGGIYGTTFLASCELYSTSNGTWSTGPTMNYGRAYFIMSDASDTCTVGSGGCPGVTVAIGGWKAITPCVYTAESWWETMAWSSSTWTAHAVGPRLIASAAASDNTGKLLVTGGFEGTGYPNCTLNFNGGNSPEYDFINGSFNSRAALPSGHLRAYHTATALSTGTGQHTVLVVGGHDATTTRTDTYTYSPSLDAWTSAGTSLGVYSHTATLLTSGTYSGQVLVMGGFDPWGTPRNTIQKYDPNGGGNWNTSFGTTPMGRAWHAAILYGWGNEVMWIGGVDTVNNAQVSLKSAYLWPSGTQTNMPWEREQFTAEFVNSYLLVAAGWRTQSGTNGAAIYNAEYYVP